MLVSCHSLIRMARLAEPLMDRGGSMTTLSYYGAEKVVDHYNVMGPVKAALEASVRYLAHELGHKAIRSEEHTSELQSLMRISYAVFCLKNKNKAHKMTRLKNNTQLN